ncbi:MAG TPA: radical SAM protein [Methanomicrobia archaeon]|nr:radical SAM protein [Methanomicrobia archaeon]
MGKSRVGKIKAVAGLVSALRKFVDKAKMPEGVDPLGLLAGVLKIGSREALAEFHRKALFIGAMHFQDAYNFDLERVKRCGIHYATPDRRIIPFCSYNAIHRPAVEKAFSVPLNFK